LDSPLPLRRIQAHRGTDAPSPSRRRTLVGLPALQSVVSVRPAGALGSPRPSGFPVSGEPSGASSRTVPHVSCESWVHPLVSFRSPAESLPLRAPFAPAGERGCLPWGSVPLRDINRWRPRAGFPGPALFRPRRFTRPRRFAPPPALRVCFTPQPRPGFALQGVSPRRSRTVSSTATALVSLAPLHCPTVARRAPRNVAPPSGL